MYWFPELIVTRIAGSLALTVLLGLPSPTTAETVKLNCSCVSVEITDSLEVPDIVFVGDVIDIRKSSVPGHENEAEVRVAERLKGRVADAVTVYDQRHSMCIWPVFYETGRYLIYIQKSSNTDRLSTLQSCPTTRLLETFTRREILALRRFINANKKSLDAGLPK